MYTPLYECKLIVQLHRLPSVRENCGKGIRGVFLGPQYYMAGKTGNLITATFAYTRVECAVSSYELVVEEMVLYTVTVRV